MKVHIESTDDILDRKADARGRINLGPELAGKEVQIAILEVKDE